MTKKIIAILSVALILGAGLDTAAATKAKAAKAKGKGKKTEQVEKPKEQSRYDKLIKDQSKSSEGFITVRLIKGKVYFEMPKTILEREMVMGSTIKSISDNGNGIVGAKPMRLKHFKFHMPDTSCVQLREISSDFFSDDENIEKALSTSYSSVIKNSFKVAAVSNDSSAVVFDATELFLNDDKSIDPFLEISAYRGYGYGAERRYKAELSYISDVKAFSDNISVTSSMSYTYDLFNRFDNKKVLKNEPLTAEMVRSIVLLPEQTYHPRTADPRIGLFFSGRTQLGSTTKGTKDVYFVNRWRLEPSDTAAYRRGEKVDPVKPIVFYVDSNFPEWWKPYIRRSASDWNEVFEGLGFKNVMVVKDFPTPQEDPEFDPDNIKYNCIRYAPINIENAMGPSWTDPRSGEIINASVYVYHDIIKLITNWMFVQTSQTDPDVRAVEFPREVLGEALCYVIRHEVGHCLGLMHNMSASYVIPVESLRDPEFTAKTGTTTSIMDYARFNYVAQPGDKERGVRLSPPKFGAYDRWAIRWAYTPVFDAGDFEEETAITTRWITDSLKAAPFYHYGKQQLAHQLYDPRRQTEDLGDDAIKATEYGVKNLKYIYPRFIDWVTKDDDDFEFRIDILNGIVNQYYRYANHVWASVGGIYINEVKQGDAEPRFQNIPHEKQKASFKYLCKMWNDCSWLSNPDVIGRLPVIGSPEQALRNAIQDMIIYSPFMCSQTDGVVSKEYSTDECFRDVFDFVWGPTRKGKALSREQRALQHEFVHGFMSIGKFAVPSSKENRDGFTADAKPISTHDMLCCNGGECAREEEIGCITYSPISGFEWQPRHIFNHGSITTADLYGQITKASELMKSQMGNANATDKAHYKLLIDTIEYSVK